MAGARSGVMARALYGLLFAVGVPLLLVAWVRAAGDAVRLPPVHAPMAGAALVGVGVALMLAATRALWRHGGGLPMNAFPPPRWVDRGIYGYLAHPMYLGFVLAVGGVALVAGSAPGLWLATPAAAAGAAALVLGYERHDLRRRFGAAVRPPRIALPGAGGGAGDGTPTAWERASVYLLVLLPWLVAYEAVHALGVPPDAISSVLPFERGWPVLEWTEAPYASAYLLVLLTPLVIQSRTALRRFATVGLVATAVVTLVYLVVPLVAPPRPFQPTTPLGRLLAAERALNSTVAAFPAFHVLWAFIAADAWPRRWRAGALAWAAVIAASCLTTGMHTVADVGAALLFFPVLRSWDRVWEGIRMGAEVIANSWREWRIGPVRVLSHGAFGGLAAGVGVVIAGGLAGPGRGVGVVAIAVSGLVMAGLWGQWLEGSSRLLRPFGFYGGVLGVLLGVALVHLFGGPTWILLGAYAVAAPFIQAIGRVRCLIQGCCHGGPAPPRIGIRYVHPRSRVTRIAGLAGVPLHPTPVYSILGNLVIGALLARIWVLGAPPTFVAGLYLVLSGIARFVEESYRAEPQTRTIAGLHIYHWLALASVLGGIALSGVDSTPPAAPWSAPGAGLLLAALATGALAGFGTGVDFPASDRRFSRLADTQPLDTATPPASPR